MNFNAELNDIKLINFSVSLDEVLPFVPSSLKVLQENGRAIISMVDVNLNNIHLKFLPIIKYGFRYVTFRLLLDDSGFQKNGGNPRGVYFLKSFSNKPILNLFSNLFANYKLTNATFESSFDAYSLKQNRMYIDYALNPYSSCRYKDDIYQKINRIDRAYDINKNRVYVSELMKNNWQIEPIKCYHFATIFFKSAHFLGAFKVKDFINHTWNNPRQIR